MGLLSLRLVIGASTTLIVVIVAAVTLTITYTVSMAAIHDAGERLSSAIARGVTLELGQYIGQAEGHMRSWVDMSNIEDFKLPADLPGYATDTWGQSMIHTARAQLIEANYSYSSISIRIADGSGIVALEHPLAYGWVTEAAQTLRNYSNGTQYATIFQRTWNVQTKAAWNVLTQGEPPRALSPKTQADSSYYSISAALGNREGCLWIQVSVDATDAAFPRFAMYGCCMLENASMMVGQVCIGRYLDRLPVLLRNTGKTANAQLFVVDNQGYLMGATGTDPALTYHPRGSVPLGQGCTESYSSSRIIGCRKKMTTYNYAPLQAAISKDSKFANQAGNLEQYGELDGQNYYYVSYRVPMAYRGYSLNLLLFMPESDVLGNIVEGRNIAIIVTVCVAVVAILLSIVLIGVLLAPIDDIARRMYYTSQLTTELELTNLAHKKPLNDEDELSTFYNMQDVEDDPMPRSRMSELQALQNAYTTMDTAIRSFTKYVPREVVKELMATNQMCEIYMRPMRCSMLFTDIAGFTSICERVAPHILSSLVRQYFERSSSIVMGHGGVIDKFIGDCIMVVWGAPFAIDHHEIRAAVCGLMLVHETQQDPLRSEFRKAGEELAIRVGVATGEVLAGNMGSRMRMNYTVIGDEVNLASRLEGLNKQWGTNVLISADTAEECAPYMHLRPVVSIAVVGKSRSVNVYEALGVNPLASTEAMGKITSEASEQISMMERERNVEAQEMYERYGKGVNIDLASAPRIFSTGKLLRRCARAVQVTQEEFNFAAVYADALQHWNTANFAAAESILRSLDGRDDVPTLCTERLSVRNLLIASERYQKTPPEGLWTGVWVAAEK